MQPCEELGPDVASAITIAARAAATAAATARTIHFSRVDRRRPTRSV
jgi:hypothetical protein